MSTMDRKALFEELEGRFGERYEAHPGRTRGAGYDPMAVVSPVSVEEVELLAEVAVRHSVRLAPEGAGTAPVPGRPPGEISVRFDLMRGASAPRPPDHHVEVQPGMSWLQLEDHLQHYRRGLRVYPSSAPQATIGGWVALDGLGIGSFEYGRLWENVVSVDVVSAGGDLRTIRGAELPQVIKPGYPEALIVGATLQTRQSEDDTPFAAAFDDPENLARAASGIRRADVRLWHLGLLNAAMARARGQEGRYMLFGAYPAERGPEIEEPLWTEIEARGGRRLPAAHRVWAERFFPVDPSQATPFPSGALVPLGGLASALQRLENVLGTVALQGSVSRSGEVVLLSLDTTREE